MSEDKAAASLEAAQRAEARSELADARGLYEQLSRSNAWVGDPAALARIDAKLAAHEEASRRSSEGAAALALPSPDLAAAATAFAAAGNLAAQHGLFLPEAEWMRLLTWRMADLAARGRQLIDQYRAGETGDALLDALDTLLDELPIHRAATPLRDTLSDARAALERGLSDTSRMGRVRRANQRADRNAVVRLLEGVELPPNIAGEGKYLLALNKGIIEQVDPRLKRLANAGDDEERLRACADLEALPIGLQVLDAQRALDDALLQQARQKIDAAMARLLDREAAAARKELDDARDTFEPLLRRTQPRWPFALVEQRERNVRLLTEQVARVVAALNAAGGAAGTREGAALNAVPLLNGLLARLQRLAADDQPFPAIANAAEVWRDGLNRELGFAADTRYRLQEAERLLEGNQLSQALASLAGIEGAPEPLRAQAAAVRATAEAQRQRAAALRDKAAGLEATNSADAIAAYEGAHELWADNAEIVDALERCLVRDGEAALSGGDETLALARFDRALALRPGSPGALAGRQRPERERRLASDLARLRAQLQSIEASPEPLLGNLSQLSGQLADLANETDALPQAADEVRALRQQAEDLGRRLDAYRQRVATAEQHRAVGDWQRAVEALCDALRQRAAPNTPPLPELAETLARWEAAAVAVAAAERELPRAIDAAGQRYERAQDGAELDELAATLAEVEQRFGTTSDVAGAAGGTLSRELAAAYGRAQALRVSVANAQRVIGIADEIERLRALRDDAERLADEPFLQRLEHSLAARLASTGPRLLDEADRAALAGDTAAEVALLQRVLVVSPGTRNVAERLARLQQRQRLEQGLQAEEQRARVANSATGSREALRAGLELFLRPEYPVAEEVRAALRTAFALADQEEDGSALAFDGVYAQAEQAIADLNASEHWSARRANEPATRWLALARDTANSAIVATQASLNQFLSGYDYAVSYRRDLPDQQGSLDVLIYAEGLLRDALHDFADKQLSRAQELLERGEPGGALTALSTLFETYYDQLAARHPGLLDAMALEDPALLTQREQAVDLRQRAAALQQTFALVNTALDRAQAALVTSGFDAAERLLAELPSLAELPGLEQRRQELDANRRDLVREDAERAIGARLNTIESALANASGDDFTQVLLQLDALRSDPRWARLGKESPVAARVQALEERTVRQSELTRDRQQLLKELAEAQTSVAVQRLGARVNEYKGFPNLLQRIELTKAFDAAEQRTKQLEEANDRLEKASRLIYIGSYLAAKEALGELENIENSLPPDAARTARITAMVEIADAGQHLERAQAYLDQRNDPAQRSILLSNALHELNVAAQLAQGKERFRGMAFEIDSLRQVIQQEQGGISTERRIEVEALRRQVNDSRRRSDYAKAAELLERIVRLDPDNAEMRDLLEQTRVDAALREAGSTVRNLLFQGKFRRARQRLRELSASLSDATPLNDVSQMLTEQEASYRASNVAPIRALVRGTRFRDAFVRVYKELQIEASISPLEREYLSDELRGELTQLRGEVVESAVDWGREQIRAAALPNQYAAVADALGGLVKAIDDSGGAEIDPRQLDRVKRLIGQANIGKLDANLALIELALRYRYEPAIASAPAPPLDEATRELLQQAPQTPDAAQDQLNEILQESADRGLTNIGDRAKALRGRIGALEERRDSFVARLADARRALEESVRYADPVVVAQALDRARKIVADARNPQALVGVEAPQLDFASDPAGLALANEIERASERFASTQQAQERAREALEAHRYQNALTTLDEVAAPWPSLLAQHRNLGEIGRLLSFAQQQQRLNNWRGALESYEQASGIEAGMLNIRRIAADDRAECVRQLSHELIDEADRLSGGALPALEGLAARMADLRANDWLTSEAKERHSQLEAQVAGRRLLDQAVAAASAETADPEATFALLRSAVKANPAISPAAQSLELLVRVRLAAQAGDLDAAQALMQAVEPEVAQLELGQRLALALAASLGERERERERQALAQLDAQFQRALTNWDLEETADILLRITLLPQGQERSKTYRDEYEQLQLAARQVREPMEEGWRQIAQLEAAPGAAQALAIYAAALRQFERAAAVGFREGARWAAYAGAMRRALELAEGAFAAEQALADARDDLSNVIALYGEARREFERAAEALVPSADEPLPRNLGGRNRVYELRRRAVYNARLLADGAGAMAQATRELRDAEQRGDAAPKQMLRLFAELDVLRVQFQHQRGLTVAPPLDAAAWSADNSAENPA